ncbi:MAG: efflux transporter outer membrane subunit [Pseudomonadota bacterium]
MSSRLFCVSRFRAANVASIFAASVWLCACTAGEDYVRPQLDVGPSWNALKKNKKIDDKDLVTGSLPVVTQPVAPWWTRFKDPVLTALVEKAIANNNDLKVAEARIPEARAGGRFAVSGLFPQIGLSGTAARGRLGASSGGAFDTTKEFGLSGSWDIDVFGGTRRRIEAAGAGIEASEASHERVGQLLVAEVARQYVLFRSLEQQRNLTLRNLKFQRDTLDITKGQRKDGAISNLEVARSQAQVSATETRLPVIKTARAATLNRLAVLIGERPGAIDAMLSRPKGIPLVARKMVVASPIAVIARRPDVNAAERQLAQSTALTGAAFTELFPKIGIDAFFSNQSSLLLGAANPWSLAASAAMPLLNFGRIDSQIDAADARQQQAYYTYKQTILLALAETENSLTAYLNEQRRQSLLEQVSSQQSLAADIAREQYKAGLTTQLDVLVAAQNQLEAENNLVLSRESMATNLIQLYTSLGEPWRQEPVVVAEANARSR